MLPEPLSLEALSNNPSATNTPHALWYVVPADDKKNDRLLVSHITLETMKNNNIITLLTKAYAAELETVQNYLANSVWLDGLRAREVAEALANDIRDELSHAEKLANRLKQLGACPPGSLDLARDQKSLQPASDSTDLRHVIEGALAAERDAITTYLEIIEASDQVDPVTQDLAVTILADEEGHRTLFEGFLKTLSKDRPSTRRSRSPIIAESNRRSRKGSNKTMNRAGTKQV